MSLVEYFSIGFALILLGRTIHYLAIKRYLRQRGIEHVEGRFSFSIPDWAEWAAYRKERVSAQHSLTWWYVMWAIQIVVLLWVVGWLAFSTGAFKIGGPSQLPKYQPDARYYTTVFDVTQSGFRQWWFSASGLIGVAAGLALPSLIRLGIFRKPPPWMETWFPRVIVGFSIFWTLTSFTATYSDYRSAVNAMQNDRAKIVEGEVMQFKPMPYTGHAMESFVVQGVRFEYSDYDVRAGFNNTSSHGGPIRESLRVKIWYLGNEILRLDIKKESDQALQSAAGKEKL